MELAVGDGGPSSVPPCASAIARLTASPSPMPVALPDANGSKRLSRLAADIPGPLSVTTKRTCVSL